MPKRVERQAETRAETCTETRGSASKFIHGFKTKVLKTSVLKTRNAKRKGVGFEATERMLESKALRIFEVAQKAQSSYG